MTSKCKKYSLCAGMIITHLLLFLILLGITLRMKMPWWHFLLIAFLPVLYFYSLFTLSHIFFKESDRASKNYMNQKKDKMEKENQIVTKEILENVKALQDSIRSDSDMLTSSLNVDEIKRMMNEAIEKYKWAYQTRFCENQVVDALLLNKMTIAREKNIPMYVQVVIPEIMEINDLDILSLFSNLIDNAIEANERLDEEDRFISVTSGTFVNVMYICVENSKSKDVTLSLEHSKTIKKEKLFHGYGIQIVKKIVYQHNGHIDVENDLDRVRVKLYIKI